MWAGNQGTVPGAGSGTCGNGTPSSSLSSGAYASSFVSTHLGQLWQGPLNGIGNEQQYLYCDSAHPHQVSSLSTLGTTCATRTSGNTVYSASYDAWGNVISRNTGGVSATLSYDALDHLVQWDGHAGTSEDYLYDASGERVLRRVVKSTGTQLVTYPFGLMDITYNSSGVQVLENDYYMLAGRLIGERESGVTVFLLTDELGSVLTSISSAAGSAAVTSTQVYSPYGTPRDKQGTAPTEKGFTGQYRDGSGLDYYNARYYDPVVGLFLSADTVQGNSAGMDPYAYVGNNPETLSDPTGQYYSTSVPLSDPGGEIGYVNAVAGTITTIKNEPVGYSGGIRALNGTFTPGKSGLLQDTFTSGMERKYGGYNPDTDKEHSPTAKMGRATGWTNMVNTWNDPHASAGDKARAVWNFVTKSTNDALIVATILGGVPEGDAVLGGIDGVDSVITNVADRCADNSDCIDAAYNMTKTVYSHFEEFRKGDKIVDGVTQFFKGESLRPYVDSPGTKMFIDLIREGHAIPDPGGVPNAFRWDEPGFFNGSEGTWQLVIDTSTNTVLHFMFGR